MHADVDWVRKLCLSFPAATEKVTWGADLTFRINEKIFAVTVLEPAKVWLSFKCSAENFAELTERAGIIPAPIWPAINGSLWKLRDALQKQELTILLRESYDLVFGKLPRKTQEALLQKSRHCAQTKVNAPRKRSRKILIAPAPRSKSLQS